jgi:acetyl-CoA C-acetyltransferase
LGAVPEAERIAVIIGVGQVNDRPLNPTEGLDSLGLMQAALRRAEADSGVGILDRLDWLGVVDQISFPDPAIHDHVARGLAARPTTVVKTRDASGDGPVRLINDAANLIAAGTIRFAAVTGGEAMRTSNKRAQDRLRSMSSPGAVAKVNRLSDAAEANASRLARSYRLLTPTDVYPLYENATRAAWGLTAAEAQAETAAIWSDFSKIAAANPNAWLRTPVTAQEISKVTADNRMISYPYTKLTVANNSVNQGAAVIITSLAAARTLGVAERKLVYVGAGAASHEQDDFLERDSYQHSASLTASIVQALEFNAITSDDLTHVELYSCFPCVPKMARRVLGWPLEKPHSVYGGLTFGGGPIGNCMMHAAAAMTENLRVGGGNGLIVANGGYATHNHSIVLSSQQRPEVRLPRSYDVHAVADALRGPTPSINEHYVGPGKMETFTAPFGRDGKPTFATVIARNPAGERLLALVSPDDQRLLQALVDGEREPVGSDGFTEKREDGLLRWRSRFVL